MKLSHRRTYDAVQGDMTPMIDCVFLLIMFFILITDLSQRELEEVYLPPAESAEPDEPIPGEIRPIVNILSDGTIWVLKEKYYDPEEDDGYAKLALYLASQARRMPTEPIEPGSSELVPKNPLLIRADQSTPTEYIQKVMEVCGRTGIRIWRVQLAAAEEPKEESP